VVVTVGSLRRLMIQITDGDAVPADRGDGRLIGVDRVVVAAPVQMTTPPDG
jgi:hypothetical protein